MSAKKEVLVVFGDRRRQITFEPSENEKEERERLIKAVKTAFSDLLELQSQPAEDSKEDILSGMYLSRKSDKWGGQLVEVLGSVEDGTVLQLCKDTPDSKVKSVSSKAFSICSKVGQPSEASASALAKLFGNSSKPGPSRKRSFDPTSDCVVAAQRCKKKATNQRMKVKTVTVVLLKEKPAVVPKGRSRSKLRDSGRVKKLQFKRCIKAADVRTIISSAFSEFEGIETAQYLRCGQDNIMVVNENQELDGSDLIELAGQGSLYLTQKRVSTEEALIAKADEVIATLKAPAPKVIDSDDSAAGNDSEVEITGESKGTSQSIVVSERESSDQLSAWRALRAEQDEAYRMSLAADQQKDREKAENEKQKEREVTQKERTNERVDHIKDVVSKKINDTLDSENEKIPIAFKFRDGVKREHTFSQTATVKDLYQFIVTLDRCEIPFTLHAVLPRQQIPVSNGCDLLSEYSLKGSTVMVEETTGLDVDTFLDKVEGDSGYDEVQVADVSGYNEVQVDYVSGHDEVQIEGVSICDEQTEFDCEYYDWREDLPQGREKERLDFMKSIGAIPGKKRTVCRESIYDDVIKVYQCGEIITECPISIVYDSEVAIDEGGVTRDMFSGFWEEAYRQLFDGVTILTPLVDAHTNMAVFPILGKIISHGYLVCGYLPVRISLPSLILMLLGPSTDIPRSFLLDALMDFISDIEREKLRSALQCKTAISFPTEIKSDVISILSRLGCRQMPTPQNLAEIIVSVAKYEFCNKPAAATTMIYCGIPDKHKRFWCELGTDGISALYTSLTVTPDKVLKIIDCDCQNPAEERTLSYLTGLIGNMRTDDLRNFLRFTTGSSVCLAQSIKIIFNTTSGLARQPYAHTCSNTLQLPVSYTNFHDFSSEWYAILGDTSNKWKWRMDGY